MVCCPRDKLHLGYPYRLQVKFAQYQHPFLIVRLLFVYKDVRTASDGCATNNIKCKYGNASRVSITGKVITKCRICRKNAFSPWCSLSNRDGCRCARSSLCVCVCVYAVHVYVCDRMNHVRSTNAGVCQYVRVCVRVVAKRTRVGCDCSRAVSSMPWPSVALSMINSASSPCSPHEMRHIPIGSVRQPNCSVAIELEIVQFSNSNQMRPSLCDWPTLLVSHNCMIDSRALEQLLHVPTYSDHNRSHNHTRREKRLANAPFLKERDVIGKMAYTVSTENVHIVCMCVCVGLIRRVVGLGFGVCVRDTCGMSVRRVQVERGQHQSKRHIIPSEQHTHTHTRTRTRTRPLVAPLCRWNWIFVCVRVRTCLRSCVLVAESQRTTDRERVSLKFTSPMKHTSHS